jgi:arsenate reductase (thioredoxin)
MTDQPQRIAFVCLHGSAKSLIAAEHLNRVASARGIRVEAESMGIEPDADVPVPVVEGLAAHGIDVRGYVPRLATAERLASATHVVSFGCDLGPLGVADARTEEWAELPMVSDGFEAAREAIVARVERLLTTLSPDTAKTS